MINIMLELRQELQRNPEKIHELSDAELASLNKYMENQIEQAALEIIRKKKEFKQLIKKMKK